MRWMDKLERRYGKYAIPNLMYYIIILYAIGFVIQVFSPELYSGYLALDPAAILHGQIWRIVTFIIVPPDGSFIFIFFSLYLYYTIGKMLEYQWGAFKFNLYFFSGMLLHVLACLLIYLVTGISLSYGTMYLNMSLFFAFAALYPDVQFLLFFIIPIKCKWLGYANGIYFAITIIMGFLVPYLPNGMGIMMSLAQFGIIAIPANSVAALVSFLNFIIFYFATRRNQLSPKQVRRRRTYEKKIRAASERSNHHRCTICGRTEKDGEDLEFRFCSKCVGNYEYCQDHLFTHEHRK